VRRGPKQPGFKRSLWIATEYERRWRKKAEKIGRQRIEASQRQVAARTKRGRDAKKEGFDVVAKLHEAQDRLQAVKVVRVKKRGRVVEQRTRSDSLPEMREDVRYWQKPIRGNRKDWGWGAVVKRLPKGESQKIREAVAAIASKRYRMKITPRTVEKCYAWFRKKFPTQVTETIR
jgi:hypothetical protein